MEHSSERTLGYHCRWNVLILVLVLVFAWNWLLSFGFRIALGLVMIVRWCGLCIALGLVTIIMNVTVQRHSEKCVPQHLGNGNGNVR